MILHRLGFRHFSKSPSFRCSNKIKDLLNNAALGVEPQNEADAQANVWSTTPYPKGAILNSTRDQSKKSKRSGKDPRETSIILFPGQGAQYVGMAKSLVRIPEAKDMFDIASEVLG